MLPRRRPLSTLASAIMHVSGYTERTVATADRAPSSPPRGVVPPGDRMSDIVAFPADMPREVPGVVPPGDDGPPATLTAYTPPGRSARAVAAVNSAGVR